MTKWLVLSIVALVIVLCGVVGWFSYGNGKKACLIDQKDAQIKLDAKKEKDASIIYKTVYVETKKAEMTKDEECRYVANYPFRKCVQ